MQEATTVFVGLDAHKASISVACAAADRTEPPQFPPGHGRPTRVAFLIFALNRTLDTDLPKWIKTCSAS